MDLSINELNSIWDDFLKAWPIEKVQSMTIDQYSQLDDHNSFTYWLEHRLQPHGSIRGGDSSKFGIYNYREPPKKTHIDTDDSYAWQRKYGDSADKAFHNVKEMILQVINAVQRENLDSVDGIDLGEAFKWKIAYHYQDRANPIVVNIFKPEMLKQYLHLTTNSMAELNKKAMLELSQYDDVFLLGKKIWQSLESNAKNSEGNTISSTRPCWFVGASYGANSEDQTNRFLEEGIWENGYEDKYLDLVRSIQEGDRIAIKSAYTRKQGLPFDNEGKSVSVMAIKAIGTVKENLGDGRNLKVKWEPIDPAREWFFYTYQRTVWKIMPGNWYTDGLIAFAFDGEPQDIERFRNDPFWFNRYGGQDKAGAALEQFLDEVASIRNLQTKEEAAEFILQDDPWAEVKTRINFIDSFNSIISNSNWQISELKTLLQSSALFSGSIAMGSMVSSFFNHPSASSWLKRLVTEVSAVDDEVNSLVEQLVNISFTGKDNKPKRSEAAYFLSMLLAARYPDAFMEFRQCRLDALTDAFGVPKVAGNYGKRLIEAGVLAGNLSSLNQFQEVFADVQYPNAVIGGLAYLIEKKEAWIEEIKMAEAGSRKENILSPLNQILYGPPGTGKTYNTKREAILACDGKAPKDRNELNQRYQELVNLGRIRFVTFHQSYSYEDFVEGIRPVMDDENPSKGRIGYRIEKVVFRSICEAAKEQTKTINTSFDTELNQRNFHKVSIGGLNRPDIENFCLENGYIALGWGGEIDYSTVPVQEWQAGRDAIRSLMEKNDYKPESKYAIQAIWWLKDFIKDGDIIIVSRGLSRVIAIGEVAGAYEYRDDLPIDYPHVRKVNWLAKGIDVDATTLYSRRLSQQSIYTLAKEDLNLDVLGKLISQEPDADASEKQYVLIIDEINRANISKVFGELITLIEEDKRVGMSEEVKVSLPYSQTEFGVPKSLHIIGTMNTADRSIAMMDTALRRRFEFKEIMPNPCLLHVKKLTQCTNEEWECPDNWDFGAVEGDWDWNKNHPNEDILIGSGEAKDKICLRRMLHAINQRIEVLYDREHTIGHAYFMSLNNDSTINDLAAIFGNKIIPLLAEYFFEDWKKIRLVLGDNQKSDQKSAFIIESTNHDYKGLFGNSESIGFADDGKTYVRNADALFNPNSYQGIYRSINADVE